MRDKEGRERIIPTAIRSEQHFRKPGENSDRFTGKQRSSTHEKEKNQKDFRRHAGNKDKRGFLPKRALSDTVAVSRGPGISAPERAIVKDVIKVEIIVIPLKYFPKIIFRFALEIDRFSNHLPKPCTICIHIIFLVLR